MENLELFKRLNIVSKNIFAKKDEAKILGKIIGRRAIDRSNIELIHLLTSDDSKFAEGFWKAFVSFYAVTAKLNSVFTLDQIGQLLELVENNHKKQKSDESKSLLESTKFFIATNGLLKKAGQGHAPYIEDEATIASYESSYSAAGIQQIPQQFFKQIVDLYRNVLKNAVLLYNGILFRTANSYEYITKDNPPPKDETLKQLEKHKLIELVRTRLDLEEWALPESSIDDRYIFGNCYLSVMSELSSLRDIIQSLFSANTDLPWHRFSYSLLFETYVGGFSEAVGKDKILLEDHDPELDETHYGDYEYMHWKDEITAESAKIFKSAATSSYHLVGSFDFLLDSLEAFYEFHGNREKEGRIPIQSLAKLAGLGNPKTIKNDASMEGSLLVIDSSDYVTLDSAEKWLKDKKRKYPYHDLIWSNNTAEELSLELIKSLRA